MPEGVGEEQRCILLDMDFCLEVVTFEEGVGDG